MGSKLSQPLSPGGKKVDSARALIARGWGVSLVSRCLRVSRAQLHVILRRTDDWKDGRRSRHSDDTDVLLRIHHVIGELPTYGYRRIWALLRRQAELDGMPAINAKRIYRIMRQNALLLERKTAVPPSKRAHTGKVAVKESNQRWCSDGFEFRCDNGEKLRVTFALDCCDGALTGSSSAVITEKNCESRSRWTAVIVRHCTGRSLRAASTVKQYRT
ncbi:IS3 family transposase [Escherichia coli]|nr:IS3 family transposase [Escherichia coli]